MGVIEGFLTKYLVRGFILSIIGAALATAGLLFGIAVGVAALEVVGIESRAVLENVPESNIQSGTLQLIGLMMAAVFFTFSNALLGQLPVVGSFAGFSNSITEAVSEIGKAVVFVAVPLTVGLILSTVIVTQMLFLDGGITHELRDVTVLSTMSVFPMVMFYQVGVQKLTM